MPITIIATVSTSYVITENYVQFPFTIEIRTHLTMNIFSSAFTATEAASKLRINFPILNKKLY